MARIFISYKRVDKDKVFKIKNQIESALGEMCWIDLDGIESDAQFANVIINAINECEIFLFMYSSAHSKIEDFESDWTVRELICASKKNKRIIFVNIDGTPLIDDLEFKYGMMQQIDGTSDSAITKLIRDLNNSKKIINVKTTWDGAGFELEDVELNQITNCDLIQQMIEAGVVPPETYKCSGIQYSLIDNNGVKVEPDEIKTLSELGFNYGDTIRIIQRGTASGGGDFASVVKEDKSSSGAGSMSELIFNPCTGEFEAISHGTNITSVIIPGMAFAGEPITEKTNINHEPTIWNVNNKQSEYSKSSFWSRLFGKRNKLQTAYSSVFAPCEIMRKQHLMIQVYLHLAKETEKIKPLATEADKKTERRGYEPLEVKLKKGDNIEIELNINSNTLLFNCKKSVEWQGAFVKRTFDYIVPADIDVNELSCSVNIFVNGAIAGEMIFVTDIVDYNPRQLNTEIFAKPTKKLFISYSHKDIKSAERIAKIHEALGIDVFFDKHRLKAGYIYSEEISKFIQTADTFVLCWSENAKESDYVEKERQEALALAYPQRKPRERANLRIHPYNIEPHATPPADMIEHYHFEEL